MYSSWRAVIPYDPVHALLFLQISSQIFTVRNNQNVMMAAPMQRKSLAVSHPQSTVNNNSPGQPVSPQSRAQSSQSISTICRIRTDSSGSSPRRHFLAISSIASVHSTLFFLSYPGLLSLISAELDAKRDRTSSSSQSSRPSNVYSLVTRDRPRTVVIEVAVVLSDENTLLQRPMTRI